MTGYDFEQARREWERVPDDIDYVQASKLLHFTDEALKAKVLKMEGDRYGSWRNWRGLWRECLGLDDTFDSTVLDFGCGIGLEALQFAKLGNRLIVADINRASTQVAQRVLKVFGFEAERRLIEEDYPYVQPSLLVDVFYANGVLHHTPQAPEILRRAAELLAPGGECRLMLYSDEGWRIATGGEDPSAGDPRRHPSYQRFLRFFDSVGFYSEPWWRKKLEQATRGFLRVERWDYITRDGRYAVAVLRKGEG